MEMDVVLIWSGARSKAVASALRDWLPAVIQQIKPWMSESDIEAGSLWEQALGEALKTSYFGIICLTPENLASPWIHYEAGALSNQPDKAHICPYLFNLRASDIRGPLRSFQAVRANKNDTYKLIQMINSNIDRPLSETNLMKSFNESWYKLKESLANIPNTTLLGRISARRKINKIYDIYYNIDQSSLLSNFAISELNRFVNNVSNLGIGQFKIVKEVPSEEIKELFCEYVKRCDQHYAFDTITRIEFWNEIVQRDYRYLTTNISAICNQAKIRRVFILANRDGFLGMGHGSEKLEKVQIILKEYYKRTKGFPGLETKLYISDNYRKDVITYPNCGILENQNEILLMAPGYRDIDRGELFEPIATTECVYYSKEEDDLYRDNLQKIDEYKRLFNQIWNNSGCKDLSEEALRLFDVR